MESKFTESNNEPEELFEPIAEDADLENADELDIDPELTDEPEQPENRPEPPAAEPAQIQTPPQRPMPRKSGRSWLQLLVALVAVTAIVLCCCGATYFLMEKRYERQLVELEKTMDTRLETIRQELSAQLGQNPSAGIVAAPEEGLTPSQVYQMNIGAVVQINGEGITNSYGQQTPFTSSASGFLISPDGYVATNFHVINELTSVSVTLSNGQVHEATVVGYDDSYELALLKIQAQDLPCVKIGKSSDLVIGEQVVAIGFPLDAQNATLTTGVISAKDRVVSASGVGINMLQTDAAINSGNSGGPLFNMKGEVIGITTAKFSGTTSSGVAIEGVGFAVPMDDVIVQLQDLMQYGVVTGAYMGVTVRDVDATAQSYGLPAGASVDEVVKGSAAEQAGIQKQDIIVDMGGNPIDGLTTLTKVLRKFRAGDTTTITVYRAGQLVELTITFQEKSEQNLQQQEQPATTPTQPPQEPTQGNDSFFDGWESFFGFDPFDFGW